MSDKPKVYLGSSYPVRRAEDVDRVLQAPVDTGNGTSPWLWFRLANGDLVFGCYPQGATYEECEVGWSDDWQAADRDGTTRTLEAELDSQGPEYTGAVALSKIIDTIMETWAGSDPEDLKESEYLRGEAELARELWGRRLVVDDMGLWPARGVEREITDDIEALRNHVEKTRARAKG